METTKVLGVQRILRQTRALRRFVKGTNDVDHIDLIDQDFAGEGGRPQEAEIFYEERNGLSKVAFQYSSMERRSTKAVMFQKSIDDSTWARWFCRASSWPK